MRNFLEKVNQIKEDLVRGGVMSSLHEMERKARPTSKTMFTLIWIVISVMVGEIIIYNHQNIFSSYATSASDIHSASPECIPDSGATGRAGYDKQVTSSEDFYKKILVKYAAEKELDRGGIGGSPSSPVPLAVSPYKRVNRLGGVKEAAGRKTVAVSAVKMRDTQKAAAVSACGNENIVIHKVKKGETLAGISKSYFRTTSHYRDIARTNNLKTPYSLKAGDNLIIMLK